MHCYCSGSRCSQIHFRVLSCWNIMLTSEKLHDMTSRRSLCLCTCDGSLSLPKPLHFIHPTICFYKRSHCYTVHQSDGFPVSVSRVERKCVREGRTMLLLKVEVGDTLPRLNGDLDGIQPSTWYNIFQFAWFLCCLVCTTSIVIVTLVALYMYILSVW